MGKHTFDKGMYLDGFPWEQPPGTYPFMLNGSRKTGSKKHRGASFEESTTPLFQFPEKYSLRGWLNLDIRDSFILFLLDRKTGVSEIGMFNKKKKNYTKIFDDSNLFDTDNNKRAFGFHKYKKMRPVVFIKQPCNHVNLIWSSNGRYWALDIDGDLCDLKYEDVQLMVCPEQGESIITVSDGGGRDLYAGAYYYAMRFNDTENNYTNFFPIEGPVYLGSDNNAPLEISDQSLRIELKDLNPKIFDRVELAIIVRSNLESTIHMLDPIYLNKGNVLRYVRSRSEFIREITIDDINIREERDIRGEELDIVNGMLVLYQTYGEPNVNLQPLADKIEVTWLAYLCPIKEAHKYTSLCYNEVYNFGIREDYCDSKFSRGFHIPGRMPTPYDMEEVKSKKKGEPAKCQSDVTVTFVLDACGRGGSNIVTVKAQTFNTSMVTSITGLIWSDRIQHNFNQKGNSYVGKIDLGGYKVNEGINLSLDFKIALDNGCGYEGRVILNTRKGSPKDPSIDCYAVVDKQFSSKDKKDAVPPENTTNCSECPQPRWKTENTATVTKWHCYDPFDKSKGSFKMPTYVPICESGTQTLTARNIAGALRAELLNSNINVKSCATCPGGSSGTAAAEDDGGDICKKCKNFEGLEYPCIGSSANPNGCIGGSCTGYTCSDAENSIEQGCRKWCQGTSNCIIPHYKTGEDVNFNEFWEKVRNCAECGMESLLDKLTVIPWTQDTELDMKDLKIRHRNGKVIDLRNTCTTKRFNAVFEKEASTPDSDDPLNTNASTFASGMYRTQEAVIEGDCQPKPKYDESGCYIIGYDLPLFAEGTMGYYESEEKYPLFENCNGSPFYGSNAGMPLRFHLMPPEDIVPHFICFQNGVAHRWDPANDPRHDGYVILLGARVKGLEKNPNPVKEINRQRPYTFLYQPRDDNNSRVIDKGIMVPTFRGEYNGEMYAHPRNGVSSIELYNAYIAWQSDPNKLVKSRGGILMDKPVYMFYGTNTRYKHPPLDVHNAYVNFNIYGPGHRFGVNAEDTHIEKSFSYRPRNQKGARQDVNLNHYERIVSKELLTPGKCNKYINYRLTGDVCINPRPAKPDPNKPNTHSSIFAVNLELLNINVSDIVKIRIEIKPPGSPIFGKDFLPTLNPAFTFPLNYGVTKIDTDIYFKITLKEGCTYEFRTEMHAFSQGFLPDITTDPLYTQHLKEYNNNCRKIWQGSLVSKEYVPPVYKEKNVAPSFCVRSASYVRSNSIFKDGTHFSYPLMNKFRESGVYIEFEPDLLPLKLVQNIDSMLVDGRYNGYPQRSQDLTADQTGDGSFFADGYIQEYPIFLASCWYVTLLRYLPRQYGALDTNLYQELFPIYEKDVLCGIKETTCGDEYINIASLKRTSLVSDHHGEDNSPGGFWSDYFGTPDCGSYLASCTSEGDDSRMANFIRRGLPPWNGRDPFIGFTNEPGTYWPMMQSTHVMYVAQSRINLSYLETGDEDKGQIYWDHLKSWNMDSQFPVDSDPNIGFLNHNHVRVYALSSMDKLILILVVFLKLTPLLYGVAGGLVGILTGAAVTVLFTFLFDQKRIADYVLGFRECRADSQGGLGLGRIKNIFDNPKKYNHAYSLRNEYSVTYGVGDKYNTCACLGNIVEGLRASNVQSVDGIQDAFRKFKPSNFITMPVDTGITSRLIKWGTQVWLHSPHAFKNTRLGDITLQADRGEILRLGSGNAFGQPFKLGGDIPEGLAGTIDPAAGIITSHGYFSYDRLSRRLYQFNGQIHNLAGDFLKLFFEEHGRLYIHEFYPELRDISVGGELGFIMGFDYENDALIITKKDYMPRRPERFAAVENELKNIEDGSWADFSNRDEFINISWTIAFKLGEEPLKVISFYSYAPEDYLFDRSKLYAFKDNTIWEHGNDAKNSFLTFYGKRYPFMVDIAAPAMSEKGYELQTLVSLRLRTQGMIGGSITQPMIYKDASFTHIWIHNRTQTTGLLTLNSSKNELVGIRQAKLTKRLAYWEVQELMTQFESQGIAALAVSDDQNVSIFTQPNNNLDGKNTIQGSKLLLSDYNIIRLIYDSTADNTTNILLEEVIANYKQNE